MSHFYAADAAPKKSSFFRLGSALCRSSERRFFFLLHFFGSEREGILALSHFFPALFDAPVRESLLVVEAARQRASRAEMRKRWGNETADD